MTTRAPAAPHEERSLAVEQRQVPAYIPAVLPVEQPSADQPESQSVTVEQMPESQSPHKFQSVTFADGGDDDDMPELADVLLAISI
jgi:hypothetical protein